jgi:MFS transporter, DHA3 family, macrolide efflux protein
MSPTITANHKLCTFYTLLITQIFSLIGSRMTGVAVGIWVFAETGETAPLLVAAFFAELPAMFGGTLTGFLADRYDRRKIMIIGDLGQAVGTVLLMISIASGAFEVWHLFVVMFIQGVFGIIQSPASDAVVATLVPEHHRDRANGLRSVGFPLAGAVAPAAAGVLYSVGGLVAVVAVDLLTFITAVVVVFLLHIPRPEVSLEGEESRENLWREITGGWVFLLRRPVLLVTVIYLAFVFFMINGPLEMAIPYISTLVANEAMIGLILSAMSAGAFAGAMTVAAVGRMRHRMRIILIGYALHGALFIVYGTVRDPWLLALTVFLLMFPLPFNGALFHTILQTKTPQDMQGRVFAVTGQIFTLTTPFSFLITAALVDNVLVPAAATPADGMGLLLVAVGLIILVATGLVTLFTGALRLEQMLPTAAAAGGDESETVTATGVSG